MLSLLWLGFNPWPGKFGKLQLQTKKKNTNELIYRTAINPQRYKTNLRLPKGKGLGRDKLGVWD